MDTSEVPELGKNDLKDVVFSRIPELKEIEVFCRDEGMGELMMSGSGATCFLAYVNDIVLQYNPLLIFHKAKL